MIDYWLALANVHGLGPRLGKRLVDRFGDPRSVFAAGPAAVKQVEGIGPSLAAELGKGPDLESAKREREALERIGARPIAIADADYPSPLADIHDPPLHVTVRGDPEPADAPRIAIVGSRKAGAASRKLAHRMARELAQAGAVIVSGFAVGIDTAAHEGALDAGGRTIAVLGCGIDIDYPTQNRALRERVCESGALVSEFAPGTDPAPENFPRRNRIISGLSAGVVVIEAGKKSGSLITARYALEQGREVLAVPGAVEQGRHAGCHWLIRQGAGLVESADDVLAELEPWRSAHPNDPPRPAAVSLPKLEGDPQRVFAACGYDPTHIDEIAQETGIASHELAAVLLQLEMDGYVEQLPGTNFRRKAGT